MIQETNQVKYKLKTSDKWGKIWDLLLNLLRQLLLSYVKPNQKLATARDSREWQRSRPKLIEITTRIWREKVRIHEGWNFNTGNYLFTTDTK